MSRVRGPARARVRFAVAVPLSLEVLRVREASKIDGTALDLAATHARAYQMCEVGTAAQLSQNAERNGAVWNVQRSHMWVGQPQSKAFEFVVVSAFECESSFVVRRKCGSFRAVLFLLGQANALPVRATLQQIKSRVDRYVAQINLAQTRHCFRCSNMRVSKSFGFVWTDVVLRIHRRHSTANTRNE
jgi:hypothetical protein